MDKVTVALTDELPWCTEADAFAETEIEADDVGESPRIELSAAKRRHVRREEVI